MNEIIRDEHGRAIAHLKDQGDTIRLQDSRFKTLGHYNKIRDITTDDLHRPIGSGNQLLRLVFDR